ncbi:MAG: NAD-dependent epimerase/dehydratase family protein [Candidatus Latescibacteria bacterium]|nr:NAD-dependent epimerase/dehydratase family protein [Candidatus Latescibacterota bacterium]
MRKILITGGAGFIGSHTADLLLQKGYQVRILDSLQERVHPRGWPAYLPPEVERLQGDVRDRSAWEQALDGVEGVFHLAAYQDYMPDFSTFFAVNTVSTALLFEVIAAANLPVQKVVLASSQSVYGEGKYHCPKDGTVYPPARPDDQLARGQWEVECPHCGGPMTHQLISEDQVNPHTAYGISKYALEMASLNLGRKCGIPTTQMRYSIVQGPRNSFYNAYSGICRIFTLRLLHDQAPICYEDGQQLRDYVYVGDVARANVLALEDPRANYRAFNVAGQKPTTVLEYAHLLSALTGRHLQPQLSGEYRFGDTRHTVSSHAALAALGWQPETPIEAFAQEYVDWVQSQPDLKDFYSASQQRMKAARILRSSSA